MRAKLLLACAVVVAGACNETFPRESAPPVVDGGLRSRPANATCVAPPNVLGRIRLEPVWQGFANPVSMIDRPDRGLVYVAEMPGKLKVVDRTTGAVTTALDLTGKVGGVPGFEDWGVFGLAIHPTEPYAYLTVERPKAGDDPALPNRTEIVRFTTSDGGRTFDPASEKVLLRVDRPTFYHSPGTIVFGPDGLLYVGIGDGGASLVPGFSTEGTLLGNIVRLDVDAASPTPEVFARGFRNPWRFTFDRATGQMWGGDVGDIRYEEVNRIEAGKDYGWPVMEGNVCRVPGCDRSGLTPPVYAYPHADGAAVTGGYVYRGKAMPDLVGKYVFGDYAVGRIWVLEGSGEGAKAILLNPGGPKPLVASFAEDAGGELYALGWDTGVVYRLAPGDPETRSVLAPRLSQTGCVDPADPKRMAPGLVPYDVNVELWSDGASKRRFIAIPDGTTVHVEDDGDMTLPEGGVLVKEFEVGGKLVETRLMLHHPGGDWSGASYEWNDEGTDAVLLEDAKTKALPNGQTWQFPSPAQCFVCHTKAAKIGLGFESVQLDRPLDYGPGDTVNQLTKLSQIGYLDRPVDPAAVKELPALTGSAPVEDRARAYLHANCSICHREGGGTAALMDFRFDAPRTSIGICAPAAFPGLAGAQIVAPGDPSRSAIFLRMSARGESQMPPLATSVVDAKAASVMEQWIRSLSGCP